MESRFNSQHHFYLKQPYHGVPPFYVAFGSNETNLIFSLIGNKNIVEVSAKEIIILLGTEYIAEEAIFQSLNDSTIQYDIYISRNKQLKKSNAEDNSNEEMIIVYQKMFNYLGKKTGCYFDPTRLRNTFLQRETHHDKKLSHLLFTAALNAKDDPVLANKEEKKPLNFR